MIRLLAVLALALVLSSCSKKSCLEGTDSACVVIAPCEKIAFTCAAGIARAYVLGPTDPIPPGIDALAAPGDLVLENDQVIAVIDALDHPHHLAPAGGMLVDLAVKGGEDGLNQSLVAAGLLPEDTAHYTSAQVIEENGVHAIILRGKLDRTDDHDIATRYEIKPCEPGIRVRTEVVNRGRDPAAWTVADAFFWGDRDFAPFIPNPAAGFVHPDFGLTEVNDVYRDSDFMAASDFARRSSSYAVVRCDGPQIAGFHSTTISAAGTPRRVVVPGDYEVYERFIAVAASRGPAPAIDVALELRRQLHGETFMTVKGTVTPTSSAPLAVTLMDGDTPRSAVVIGADGTFEMRAPTGKAYAVALEMFGKVVDTKTAAAGAEGETVTVALTAPAAGEVVLDVSIDGAPKEAQVFFAPADAATKDAVAAQYLSTYATCAPLLGPVSGASPACNRVLTRGPTKVLVPPGKYLLRATAGIAASLAEATIDVAGGASITVPLALATLDLMPPGTLSADFHVHGGRSFDSAIPDLTRIHAFLASGLDVVAATDHDVVTRYTDALGVGGRLIIMTGIETTGNVLHEFVPDETLPKVIGHWNFWPMAFTPASPYRGGAWDELMEPGTLFATMRQHGLSPNGVIQLNHPFTASSFGRDLGYPQAIGFTTEGGIPTRDDGSAQALISRVPPQGGDSNLAYDTQEVMNGTDNLQLQAYRAYWHFLLDSGVVRAATANSDSHGLTDAVVGTPRTIVFTRLPFDESTFQADVKAGRMIGTNGPIILASLKDTTGATRAPSILAIKPAPNATLDVVVRAPPWAPVAEVRIIVDGKVARTITDVSHGTDPLATRALEVWRGSIALAELLPADGLDHWISVEAGSPLPATADLNCDGIPDTTDNNRDGVIDERDAEDFDPLAPGIECDYEYGPVMSPPPPADPFDPLARFDAVTPGGFPFAFTNPLLIDADGNGFEGAAK